MAISKASGAKRALYNALKGNLTGVNVWNSAPNSDHAPNENVTVGRVEVDQEWGSLGGGNNSRRDEDILITVTVQVFKGGTNEFEAEDRCWEIADLIQAAISTDLTLGGAVRYCRPDRLELEPQPYQEGREAVLTITVRCRADNH